MAEKLSALLTEEYLASRAGRGSRAAYLKALAKAPDVPPVTGDALRPVSRKPSAATTRKRRKPTRS